jgi:transcriptional regulator with XRE-family HTH domain
MSGLASDTIRRLERGSFSPSHRTLSKLAAGLAIPVRTLLDDDLAQADDFAECIRALPERESRIAIAMVRARPASRRMVASVAKPFPDRRGIEPPCGFEVMTGADLDPDNAVQIDGCRGASGSRSMARAPCWLIVPRARACERCRPIRSD